MRWFHMIINPIVAALFTVHSGSQGEDSLGADGRPPIDDESGDDSNHRDEPPDRYMPIRHPHENNVIGWIVRDEIVTPAPIDLVRTVLSDAQIRVAVSYLRAGADADLPLAGGLNAYAIAAADAADPAPDPADISARLIDAGIPASPRHLVMPAPRWKFGPAEPATLGKSRTDFDTQQRLERSVRGTVVIIDTGAAPDPLGDWNHAWDGILADPAAVLGVTDSEPSNLGGLYAGHGVFAAGIVRRLLPDSVLSIRSAMIGGAPRDAVMDEGSVTAAIAAAEGQELGAGGVVNLSLGTYAVHKDQIPLEMAAFFGERANADSDVAFVAAAGNDGVSDVNFPFWPAGLSDPCLVRQHTVDRWSHLADFPELKAAIDALLDAQDPCTDTPPVIVGVGALDAEGAHASFSNSVGATVWAPGTDVVSTYPADTGFASWSGTSFAAPFVSALVAGCRKGTTYRESLAVVRSAGPDVPGPLC